MGWTIETKLSCTNPELICSGSTFIENTKDKLWRFEDGKPVFHIVDDNVKEELIRLSKEHPEEVFCQMHFYKYADNNIEKNFGAYINGRYNAVTSDPAYTFQPNSFEGVDSETYDRFQQHVLKYLKRLDLIKETKDQITTDFLNDQEPDEEGFTSYYMVVWENDEHEFTAFKRGFSGIEVIYKRKPKRALLQKSAKSNDPYDEHDSFPF